MVYISVIISFAIN